MLESFWPPISPMQTRTPRSILELQATHLAAVTNGMILASVKVDTESPGNIGEAIRQWFPDPRRLFVIQFGLVVPELNNYYYCVLRLWHGLELYPVVVSSDFIASEDRRIVCRTEAEFESTLKAILGADALKVVIERLLALAS